MAALPRPISCVAVGRTFKATACNAVRNAKLATRLGVPRPAASAIDLRPIAAQLEIRVDVLVAWAALIVLRSVHLHHGCLLLVVGAGACILSRLSESRRGHGASES